MLNKNIEFIQKQLNFMYGKIGDRTKERHSVILKKYERIANSLYPLITPGEDLECVLLLESIRARVRTGYDETGIPVQ